MSAIGFVGFGKPSDNGVVARFMDAAGRVEDRVLPYAAIAGLASGNAYIERGGRFLWVPTEHLGEALPKFEQLIHRLRSQLGSTEKLR